MKLKPINKPNGLELNQGIEQFQRDLRTGECVFSVPKMVACFGGAAIRDDTPYKKDATKLAELLAKEGISLITGGGPGIMNAANAGAYRINPKQSYGLRVKAIHEGLPEVTNSVLAENLHDFDTLAIRLLTLIGCSNAIVFFPGGFGTLEEMFSLLVRVRLDLMKQMPIYFYGEKFWTGLKSWMESEVLGVGAIKKEDLALFSIEDDIDVVVRKIIDQLG